MSYCSVAALERLCLSLIVISQEQTAALLLGAAARKCKDNSVGRHGQLPLDQEPRRRGGLWLRQVCASSPLPSPLPWRQETESYPLLLLWLQGPRQVIFIEKKNKYQGESKRLPFVCGCVHSSSSVMFSIYQTCLSQPITTYLLC